MSKKIKKTNGIKYVAISLIAIVCMLAVTTTVAANQSLKQLIASAVANIVAPEILGSLNLEEEDVLGAFPSPDIYNAVTFYDDVNLGDGRNRQDIFHKIISFTDATTTAVVFNPDDEGINNFILTDVWLENSGKATSTVRICVTTSTAEVIARDDNTYLVDDAGQCTLMRTLGNAFGNDGADIGTETATSSLFSILKYPGTNTFIAAQKVSEYIASTTNILVFATSTGDNNYPIEGTGNTFDGKLHIVGYETDQN